MPKDSNVDKEGYTNKLEEVVVKDTLFESMLNRVNHYRERDSIIGQSAGDTEDSYKLEYETLRDAFRTPQVGEMISLY